MDPANQSTQQPGISAKRQWPTRLVWGVAIFCALCALVLMWQRVAFPAAIAKNPVRAEGIVTVSIINGFGGDPAVEYRYTVAGRTYKGEGNGELGHQRPEFMRPGDPVAIEYAAETPSESCTCNAVAKQPGSTASTVLAAVLLCAPLCILFTWRWARQRARRT